MGSPTQIAKVPTNRMLAFPEADAGFQIAGPWDKPGTRYFYAGPFSSFASFGEPVGLPAGYAGHAPGERCQASSRESYFAACKASDRETFEKILAMAPAAAKHAGGLQGIIGTLRPDWEEIKYAVMLTSIRGQFSLPAWLALLLSTGNATLCERSTRNDSEWGGWDQHRDSYTGRNLLGVGLMHARADLRARVLNGFVARGFTRPFLFSMPGPVE